jgi:hypothetical protein
MDPNGRYLLDNAAPEAQQRFDGLAAIFNATTFRHMEALGIAPGWQCWEVGVGGPSIPRWQSERVGPSGRILATDIDVRWVQEPIAENVTVLHHDVVADPPPSGSFDLVHERLVLIHLPARETVIAKMIDALAPGGWLLVEDYDSNLQPYACPDVVGEDEQRANQMRAGLRRLLSDRGADMEFGRRLPRLLRDGGLLDVGADAYFPTSLSVTREMEIANVQQLAAAYVSGGHVSEEEVDAHLEAVRAGRVVVATPPLISAWGRRP